MAENPNDLEKSTIKIRLIENGILVGQEGRWFQFKQWEGKDGASEHVQWRLVALHAKRVPPKV